MFLFRTFPKPPHRLKSSLKKRLDFLSEKVFHREENKN